MDYRKQYEEKKSTLRECLGMIKSGDVISSSVAACEAVTFLEHIHEIAPDVENVTIYKSKDNDYPYLHDDSMKGHLYTKSHLFSRPLQDAQKRGMACYVPSDLSTFGYIVPEIDPNNVFIAQTTDMDENGNFQIPYSSMYETSILECAETVILEVNPDFKTVTGGIEIPISRVSKFYISQKPPLILPVAYPTETDRVIGSYIADFINDGDCIQLGLGRLPDAVAVELEKKNDLGLHSEMLTSNCVHLIRSGNLTGKYKTIENGLHVGGFALGDQEMYDILHEYPNCQIRPCSYVNNPAVISQIDNMKSVNTCMEIDLLGQVCSETIGSRQFSGTGGACDFAQGALRSKGGRGIIAFNSTASNGKISKIKSVLTRGAAVTIPRNFVDTVITEYGVAELKGRTIEERAEALIEIAHPDFRDQLRDEAKELGYIRG